MRASRTGTGEHDLCFRWLEADSLIVGVFFLCRFALSLWFVGPGRTRDEGTFHCTASGRRGVPGGCCSQDWQGNSYYVIGNLRTTAQRGMFSENLAMLPA
jgi:hypothetical protein